MDNSASPNYDHGREINRLPFLIGVFLEQLHACLPHMLWGRILGAIVLDRISHVQNGVTTSSLSLPLSLSLSTSQRNGRVYDSIPAPNAYFFIV